LGTKTPEETLQVSFEMLDVILKKYKPEAKRIQAQGRFRGLSGVYFISGHGDLTPEEFDLHYRPAIDRALSENAGFIMGDFRGADSLAQEYIFSKGYAARALVCHMFETPRNNHGLSTLGGFQSDEERDSYMTKCSSYDIVWIRPGRENSGTARNIERRNKMVK
jgi:hypothetical protein